MQTHTDTHTQTVVVLVGTHDATAEPSLPMSPGWEKWEWGVVEKRERRIKQQQKQEEPEWEGRLTD